MRAMAETSEKKKQKPATVFRNTAWLFSAAWKIAPRFVVTYFVCAFLNAVWGILEAWYIKEIFNRLDGGATLPEILRLILVVALLTILIIAATRTFWEVGYERQQLMLRCGVHLKLFDHAISLDLGKYEIPEFYNDFIWAMNNADRTVCSVLDTLWQMIMRLTGGTAVFVILLDLDPLVAAVVLVSAGIGIVCSAYVKKQNYEYDMACRRARRVSDYVCRVHDMPDYAKELRISEASTVLDKLYEESLKERRSVIGKYVRRASLCGMIWNTTGAIKDNGLLLLLLYQLLIAKTLPLGGFALAVTASWRVSSALKTLFNAFTDLSKHSLYIDKLRVFLDTKTAVPSGDKQPGDFESIEFCHVGFAYADGTPVLRDVSFRVDKGRKIALVGYNGAGKTTLIKLLMRFYDVTDGAILYNDTDIRDYDLTAYRAKIAAVFQDYKIFAATVAENVAGGACFAEDRPRVTAALNEATFGDRLAKMDDGIDTPLTREFDERGVNLSGGEAQKIAIARAFFRRAAVTVMDEPSAALDPVAEYELNTHIRETLEGDTVIFISHRLSTTRDADEIFVLDGGSVAEHGSHNALMRRGGIYASLFNLQAEKYRT
jgi:ATP-binding cassette subfamily B protein